MTDTIQGVIGQIVKRREPNRYLLLPVRRNVRVIESIPYAPPPDPVHYGAFEDFGKPYEHARARASIAITGIAVDAYRAVMADEFGAGKIGGTNAINVRYGMPRGGQLPYRERINLARNPAMAYGSLFELAPPQGV